MEIGLRTLALTKDFWIRIFKEFDQGTRSTMPGFFRLGPDSYRDGFSIGSGLYNKGKILVSLS